MGDQGEYVDLGESGAKDRRPKLDEMMTRVRRGGVDVLAVWKFDRFARSVRVLGVAAGGHALRARRAVAIVKSWGLDPYSGHRFAFIGKRADQATLNEAEENDLPF